jgi:hypothetical protein
MTNRKMSLVVVGLAICLVMLEIRIWVSNVNHDRTMPSISMIHSRGGMKQPKGGTPLTSKAHSTIRPQHQQLQQQRQHQQEIRPIPKDSSSVLHNQLFPPPNSNTTKSIRNASVMVQPSSKNEVPVKLNMCIYKDTTTTTTRRTSDDNNGEGVPSTSFPSLAHSVWEPTTAGSPFVVAQQQQQQQDVRRPLSVGLVLRSLPLRAEAMHILYDGVQRSQYLELKQLCFLADDPDASPNCTVSTNHQTNTIDVWIVNALSVKTIQNFDEHPTIQALLYPPPGPTHRTPPWKVLIVDYSDKVSLPQPLFYRKLFHSNSLKKNNNNDNGHNNNKADQQQDNPFSHVRIAMRTIVVDRYFDETLNRIVPGKIYNFNDDVDIGVDVDHPNRSRRKQSSILNRGGGPPLHAPYPVRSDTVQAIRDVLPTLPLVRHANDRFSSSPHTMNKNKPCPATDLERSMDVMHMWVIGREYNDAHYRNEVSKVVASMNGTWLETMMDPLGRSSSSSTSSSGSGTNGRPILTSTELQGKNSLAGRNDVSVAYVKALLTTKIVICVQRDKWEDHYRLMEGLAAGAMIFSDTMLGLPRGLEDGKGLILFHNLTQLRDQLVYYLQHEEERLAIAKRGWEIAMGRHRSWHRLEELLFGCPLTQVNEPYHDILLKNE